MAKQKNKETKNEKPKQAKQVETTIVCGRDCPKHGNLKARGKAFEGIVRKKFHKRILIEFERMVYIRKYERYAKSRTKIHARLPECMEGQVQVGDLVRVRECRPLSKIIHAVVVEKIKGSNEQEKK